MTTQLTLACRLITIKIFQKLVNGFIALVSISGRFHIWRHYEKRPQENNPNYQSYIDPYIT